jgi:hypothetical protein
MVAGISQQPPILRHPEQLEAQENCWSSEADGLQKRPPTIHLATLDTALLSSGITPKVHFANRDDNEQYIMVFTGSGVRVWDLKGNEKTVNYATGSLSYITAENPRGVLRAVTVADYTFIINNTITAVMSTENSPDVWGTQGALINVKSGQYGRTYSITLDSVEVATFATPDGSAASHTAKIDTNYIADQLVTSLATGYTVSQKGEGWLYITKNSGSISSVKTKDGFNNQAMFGFLTATQKFSTLPAQAPNGYVIEVTGEPGNSSDNYYLTFDVEKGVWKETVKPAIPISYDASTMPHVLIREADGTFTFKPAEWQKRTIGDDDSNPIPSFIGKQFNDIFFFRNRLGLLAGENVILSKSGEFFKFWMTTAFEVLDTDMIDDAAPNDSVSTLYHATPFDKNILLSSETTQFLGKSEGPVTPKSFRIDHTTDYACEPSAKPVGAGRRVYFPSARQEYTSLLEYYAVQEVTEVNNAQDVSSHVPSLIPNGVYSLLANTRESLVLLLTSGDPTKIFIYKYLFQNEVRLQSSWSHWEFGTAEILGAGFIGSTLYLLMKREEGLFLEKMLFTYNTKDLPEEPYRAFLDRKVVSGVIPGSAYDALRGTTQVNLHALYGTDLCTGAAYGVLLTDGWYSVYNNVDCATGLIEIPGDVTGQKIIVGETFEAFFMPSTIMIKTDDGKGGTKADTEGRLQVKRYWLNFNQTGYFKVTIEHLGKQTFKYEWTSRVLGASANVLGSIPLETGTFTVPIQSINTGCKIIVSSSAPTPFSFIGAGWEGTYYRRSQRL